MIPEKLEKFMGKLNVIAEKVAKADKENASIASLISLMETVSLFSEIYDEGVSDGWAEGFKEGKKAERIRMEKEQTKLN